MATLATLGAAGSACLGPTPSPPQSAPHGAAAPDADPARAAATTTARATAGAGVAAAPPDAAIAPETTAQRGTHLALLYSSNLEGEYEQCGCPSHPEGGLTRRATVIDQARGEADGVLVVDAGDMLLPASFHDGKLLPPRPDEVERRARLLLASFARMGLGAFLPAERDLAVGAQKLKQLLKSFRIPTVAANLVGRDGRPFFERDRIVTVAGIPIGVFGLVEPQPEDAALWKAWPVRATPPEAAAREEVASLRARGARMIVALLHLGQAGAASKLLETVAGIDWAVEGHAGLQLQPPSVVRGARLVDAMSTGKLAGRLDIHIVGGAVPVAPSGWRDRGERTQLLTIIADHRQQLAELARQKAADKDGQLDDFLRQRREAITRALDGELEAARRLPTAIAGSWYEGRIISLDEAIPDQRGVAVLVAAYNRESARRAGAGLPIGIALRGPQPPYPRQEVRPGDAGQEKPTYYAGSAACAACHPAASAFFATTKHAHALDALAAVKGGRRDHDPTCVGCHTTGFMLAGGTWSVDIATTRLRDVGCESCHGPSLGHVSVADKKTTTRRQVPETVCRGCHTPDQTNGAFDYEALLKAILGPGHGA